MLSRAEQEADEPGQERAIIEMLTTIMAYKFTQLTRQEVESMLGITLQETRFYQEAREEGLQFEACRLVVRLLTRRLQQQLSSDMRDRLANLPLLVLEDLSEALLDFTTLADLEAWLAAAELER